MHLNEILVCAAVAVGLSAVVMASAPRQQFSATAFMKRAGQSVLIYTEESDDVLPFSHGYKEDWNGNMSVCVPTAWKMGCSELDRYAWANAVAPYKVTYRDWELPGVRVEWPNPKAPADAPLIGVTYNGLLHRLSSYSIRNTSVPLVWTGRGAANYRGLALSVPALVCGDTRAQRCVFAEKKNDENLVYGTMFAGAANMKAIDGKMGFFNLDGSIRTPKPGVLTKNGRTDPKVDPYMSYESGGVPREVWWDGQYPTFFRPILQ